jgi:hypothetical protein
MRFVPSRNRCPCCQKKRSSASAGSNMPGAGRQVQCQGVPGPTRRPASERPHMLQSTSPVAFRVSLFLTVEDSDLPAPGNYRNDGNDGLEQGRLPGHICLGTVLSTARPFANRIAQRHIRGKRAPAAIRERRRYTPRLPQVLPDRNNNLLRWTEWHRTLGDILLFVISHTHRTFRHGPRPRLTTGSV